HGDADLLEVVGALRPAGGLAGRLDRWQQQGNEDRDDGDHHEKLDQRKPETARAHELMTLVSREMQNDQSRIQKRIVNEYRPTLIDESGSWSDPIPREIVV